MKSLKQTSVLMGIGVVLAACSGSDEAVQPSAAGVSVTPGTDSPAKASCLIPEAGCACTSEGQLIQCGKLIGTGIAGQKICQMGYRRCVDGSWSGCDSLANQTPQPPGLGVQSPVVILPGNCAIGNTCDPYCRQFGEANLNVVCPGTGRDWTIAPNGPPPTEISTLLTQAGITSPGWYHELDPGDTAIDPLSMSISLSTVDVYFLLNATDAMNAPINGLADGIAGTVATLKAQIPNVAFGVGTFVNYQAWPYGPQTWGNTLYENQVSISTNEALTVAKIQDMKNHPENYFFQVPYAKGQSSIPALFAAATNAPLMGRVDFTFPSNNNDAWYNVFRYYGRSPTSSAFRFTANTAAPIWGGSTCANGIGAPCFRPNAYHIVMLVQDAPAMNGPGGSFPYYQMKPRYFRWNLSCDYTTENSWYWFYSPSVGAAGNTPVLPANNGAVKANTLGAATGKTQVYFGNLNVSGTTSSYSHTSGNKVHDGIANVDLDYDTTAMQKCTGAKGTGADAYYDFTVAADGTRYWFDTVGSSYDTVLYLINRSTNKVMACNDDAMAYLSMGNCKFPSDAERGVGKTNSAIVGTLPAGDYRLVIDKYDTSAYPAVSQEVGIYQLNMWPNFDDPFYAGDPAATAYSTPSYTQTLARMRQTDTSFMVGAIESSGYTCGESVTDWEKAFTRWSLEGIANDTGAIVNGAPLVYSVKQNGTTGCATGINCDTTKCPANGTISTVLGNAVAALTQNVAQPIQIVGVDFDDPTDFDGVSGVNAGSTVLTPTNIDDATFISKITAKAAAGCTIDGSGTFYSSCMPGSSPNFDIQFKIPTGVTPIVGQAQIFHFHVEMRGMNGKVLATQPVTIVVPPGGTPYTAVDVDREFHAADACATGTHPVWLDLGWNSLDPGGSYIQFFVKAAATAAGLDTATEIATPIGVARSTPTDTQVGAANLGQFLSTNGLPAGSPFVRVRAHLVPTTSATPVLFSYTVEIDCLP
jgi:hypothetical protein